MTDTNNLSCIAAVSKSWGIGYQNQLLYRIPEDLQYFKQHTQNRIVIMGRNTYENIGRPLPHRKYNIILTTHDIKLPDKQTWNTNVILCHDISLLIKKHLRMPDTYVIGGAMLYQTLLPYCKTAYITHILDDKPADTFFPDLTKEPNWHITNQSELKTYQGLEYQHVIYENNHPKQI